MITDMSYDYHHDDEVTTVVTQSARCQCDGGQALATGAASTLKSGPGHPCTWPTGPLYTVLAGPAACMSGPAACRWYTLEKPLVS